MRNYLFTALFFFFEAFGAVAQAQEWKWQNPFPTGNDLGNVQFVDSLTAYTIGNFGTILKTIDGGINWLAQDANTEVNLSSVYFINPIKGWITGDNGTILHTLNGGDTWFELQTGTSKKLTSVYFVDDWNGWAVGAEGTTIKTTDGGSTWTSVLTGFDDTYQSVQFFNQSVGVIALGSGKLLRTQNGGVSWQLSLIWTSNANLYSIKFINSQIGWAVGGNGVIAKTTNGGVDWVLQNSGWTNNLRVVFPVSAEEVWVITTSTGLALRTQNGGDTWQNVGIESTEGIYGLYIHGSQNGCMVGLNGTILRTGNGGNTWGSNQTYPLNYLRKVTFLNENNGIAVGTNGTVLTTNNGGTTWVKQQQVTLQNLNSCYFRNNHGYAVGTSGMVLRTINGGINWQHVPTSLNITLTDVFMTNDLTVYAVGGSGTIARFFGMGNLLTLVPSPTTSSLSAITFSNPQTGWIVAGDGSLLKSEDGGNSWSIVGQGIGSNMQAICFPTDSMGIAVGPSGRIVQIHTNPFSIEAIDLGLSTQLNSISFSTHKDGIVVGNDGVILKTKDGGNSWVIENSGTNNSLFSCTSFTPACSWIVGQDGTILKQSLPISDDTLPKSIIKGRLFRTFSADCNQIQPEYSLPRRIVKAYPGPIMAISNAQGIYQFQVPSSVFPSNYIVKAIKPIRYNIPGSFICPAESYYQCSFAGGPDTLTELNFGYQFADCHNLIVDISTNRRRRCFRNFTKVSYHNEGNVAPADPFVLVTFPHWVKPLNATIPYVVVNDSVWKFSLDSQIDNNIHSFEIIDSVVCNAPMGTNQCTKAEIYPVSNCQNHNAWNQSEISVSGECVDGQVVFVIQNKTIHPMEDSTAYWIYLDSIQVKVGKIKLAAGDSLHVLVQTDGMTATILANQVAGHPTSLFVSSAIENCSNGIFYPRQMANHFPHSQTPVSKTQCLPIRDSYDPNDKQAFPIGFTANHVVKPGTEMEYLVRFQNTGNDTAFTVYVIDSLDSNLNVESLEIGAVSHPYELTLQTTRHGRNFLRWQFNHINLPDSNVNELKSHGFVQYRISPKPGLTLGSQARNEAAIFFDFNLPVLTNQTLTTFDNLVFTNPSLNDNVQIITASASSINKKEWVQVSPNPFSEGVLIQTQADKPVSVVVCDMMGKTIRMQTFTTSVSLSLAQLPAGVYLLKFPELNRVVKVVKE